MDFFHNLVAAPPGSYARTFCFKFLKIFFSNFYRWTSLSWLSWIFLSLILPKLPVFSLNLTLRFFTVFSSGWLCQQLMKSKFARRLSSGVRPSSFVHPSVVSIIFEQIAWLSFKFGCGFPRAIPLGWFFFLNFRKKKFFFIFYKYFFVFSNMGLTTWEQKIENATPATNRSRKFSNFSWIFFPTVLTQLSEYFKTLLLQMAAKRFQTCPEFSSEFSSQWSSQNGVWDFWNFESDF